ncbi:hypothetical protein BD770DRAFT_367221 [Pilaira anomala]|nr:hypothetical protein BD770DRAFT_367221 [Pilaira anomala]
MSTLKLQEERNEDSPMQVNVTDNSPNNNNNSRKEEFKYDCDTTPCFPVFILNNLDDSKKHLSINNTIEQKQQQQQEEEEEDDDDEVWRNEFMDFMSRLIGYSEELESISFELLRTEGKVRKLILLQKTILEELEETERMYIDRINECERISDRQNEYMNELMNLDAELTSSSVSKKVSNNNKRMTTNSTSTLGWKSSEYSQRTRSATSTNTTVDSKYLIYKSDAVNTFKWKLGTWIGGGVGNGNLIHAYHHPVHQRLELIVVGSGTIATQYEKSYYLHKHDYILYINYYDRRKRFQLLPNHLWTPDTEVTRCQFKTNHTAACSTRFNLLQRRHHCRKCGDVICQRHSLNRLPLFKNLSSNETWCRVCDTCFHNLIVK